MIVAMKCENCLYRKNCQFIAKHKEVTIDDCTAFVDEIELITKIRTEAIKEFSKSLTQKMHRLYEYDEGGWGSPVFVVEITDIDSVQEEMISRNNRGTECYFNQEPVRRKDCKHLYFKDMSAFCPHKVSACDPEHYCAYGVRKERE